MFGGHNRAGYFTKDSTHTVSLHEEIGTVTRQTGDFVSKIDIAGFLKCLNFVLGSDFIEHGPEVIVIEDFIFDSFNVASNPKRRGLTGRQMKV